jgi:hypothetical protein
MKSYKSIIVQLVFLLSLSHLSFSQEVEVNLGGNSTSDAFVVRDTSGSILLKMDGDKNFGINTEQPDGIEIKGRDALNFGENGDSIKITGGNSGSGTNTKGGSVSIIGGSSDEFLGGSVEIIGGYGDDYGGSVSIIGGAGDYYGGSVTIATDDGATDGGNIDIITDGVVYSGDINISTGSAGNSGDINISTGQSNENGGSITLSTGLQGNLDSDITLKTEDGDIELISGNGISLKTTDDDYEANIRLETADHYYGGNSILLTVGDGGGGIILNPNQGLVEVIGSGTYTGTWTQASDERYKNNVKPLLGISNKVKKLQPVEYEWNKEEFPENNFPDGNQIGLIAQEVEKLFPELVATNQDGYKSIDYSKISVLLLQAMKEQQDEIEKQSDEINQIKSELEELKSVIMQGSNKFSSIDNQQEVD